MTIPRQLAPTVGPAHGGVEFLKGSLSGIEKLQPAGSVRAGVEEFTPIMRSLVRIEKVVNSDANEIEFKGV